MNNQLKSSMKVEKINYKVLKKKYTQKNKTNKLKKVKKKVI